MLAALAAGLNDLSSGAWSVAVCAKNRQLGDFWKIIKSKPGCVMMLCAVIGGLFATENGVLNECDRKLDSEGELQTFYAANDFGKDMIRRYIE